ncbi:MAG: AsmA family protein [Rhodospirillaceae bacterium]|nr:AsmA family protein [Rhodospirillaceae bacterium]
MKKLLFGFLFLIVGLFAAVLVAPNFINWNEYRDVITDEVNAATGFNLEIRGDIKISILPSPALLINQVHVANIEGAARADTLAVDSFEVRVALAPLLGGQLQIRSVKLVKPVLSLEVLADGRTNMAFKIPEPKAKPAQAAKKDNKALPFGSLTGQASGGGEMAIRVDDFVIEKGAVFYRDDTKGQVESVENLNGRFALASLSGPMESSGSAVIRGVPMSFSASAGTMIQGRTLPFNFALKVIPGETNLRFSGALTRLNENPQVKGKLNVAGQNLAAFVSAITGGAGLPDSLALPFGADAVVAGDRTGGSVSDLQVKLNGTQGSGKVEVKLAKATDVNIQMAVNKLDIDALLAPPKAATKAPAKSKAQKNSKGKTAAKAISPIAQTLSTGQKNSKDVPFRLKNLPEDLNIGLNLSVAAITYKGAVVRQAKINSSLANREVTISQASALLPGSTDVALFGFISEDNKAKAGRPTFDGNVDLATNDLRGLLGWASIDVSDISKDRLRKFTFGGKVTADARAASLKEIAVNLDSSKIKGGANIAFRQRLSFGLNLSIDRFNLDAYLPRGKASVSAKTAAKKLSTEAQQAAVKSSPAPAPVPNPLAALAPLGDFDANIAIDLKSLTVQEIPIKGLHLTANIFDGKLTLKQFRTANAAGMTVNVSGDIAGLKNAKGPIDPSFKNFKFNLRGKSLARLFSLTKITPPVSARQLGAVRLSGTLNGKPHVLNVTTDTAMLGGKFTLNGVVKPLTATPSVDGQFSANHPNMMKLFRRLGSTYRPAGRVKGGINLRGRIAGNAKLMAFSNLAGKAAGITLKGGAAIDLSRVRPVINANLKTSPIVIDDLLPAKRTAYLDRQLREFEHALRSTLLVPASFSSASRKLTSPIAVFKVAAKSGAPWTSDPIDISFLKQFDGKIQLQSESLRFQKYLASSVSLASAVNNGVFDLQRLTGKAYGGDVKIDGRVIAGDKRNQYQSRFNIAGFDAGKLLSSLGTKGFRRGALDVVGEFRTLGRSTRDLVRELGGGGTISVRGLNISSAARRGSAFSGIAGLFLSLNQFGSTLTGGKTSSKSVDFRSSFRMAKGVARFEDMSLASGMGNGSAKGMVDLPNWRINVAGDIEMSQNILAQVLLRNSSKSPLLPFKISGRLDNPKVKLETAALTKGGIRLPGSIGKKLDKIRKKKGVGAILDQIFPQAKSGSSGSPSSGSPPPQSPPPQQAPQQQQQQQKKPKVEDFLKGILKGLSR